MFLVQQSSVNLESFNDRSLLRNNKKCLLRKNVVLAKRTVSPHLYLKHMYVLLQRLVKGDCWSVGRLFLWNDKLVVLCFPYNSTNQFFVCVHVRSNKLLQAAVSQYLRFHTNIRWILKYPPKFIHSLLSPTFESHLGPVWQWFRFSPWGCSEY